MPALKRSTKRNKIPGYAIAVFLALLLTALGVYGTGRSSLAAQRVFASSPATSPLERRIDYKIEFRKKFLSSALRPLSEPLQTNQPAQLVDEVAYTDLDNIEQAGLMAATVPVAPWADDYWPLYMGGIAKRYSDPWFPFSKDWKLNTEYLINSPGNTDLLSPAEKYDLLVGDPNYSLTRSGINAGGAIYERIGMIDSWLGYCHGWAAAAIMEPRPIHPVTLTAADGRTRIRFFPSDIKALATLLWANGRYALRFMGGKCETRRPKVDGNLRTIDPACQDIDPASWHISVVNQIGHSRRGLVMDAMYDNEVWNQPIVGYSYQYFNPETGEQGGTLNASTVPMRALTHDRFAKYRSPNAGYLVGISMDVTYVYETQPSHRMTDNESEDTRVTTRYMYDLEIDSTGKIIGGEWYQLNHPDFLWVPARGTSATTLADETIASSPIRSWPLSAPFPAAWKDSAIWASVRNAPIAHVVTTLLRAASK